ncbi:MAG: hypothetical protein K2X04_07205 [Burkholderiales bacterium]|nr:hypothetical protein [Burkholderiales bacterium]
MKLKPTLLTVSLLSIFVSACNGGSSTNHPVGGGNSLQAIIPAGITTSILPHGVNSNYVAATDNMLFVTYKVTNRTAKATLITSLTLTGTNPNAFRLESNPSLYPSTQASNICSAGVLAGNSSCYQLVTLTNPSTISTSKLTANLSIVAGGQPSVSPLSQTSYAYLAGSFSKVYANPAESIAALSTSTPGNCGAGWNTGCLTVAMNLATRQLNSIAVSDFPAYSLAVGNGTLYSAGAFTSASNGTQTISMNPAASSYSSMILAINPIETTTPFKDLQALAPASQYPNGPILALSYSQGNLYVAGGFNSLGGVSSSGFPIVQYNPNTSAYSNALGSSGDASVSIGALGFDNNNQMYVSGYYDSIGGVSFSNLGDNYQINACSATGCSASDAANTIAPIIDGSGGTQPTSSITFDATNKMYAAGGITTINGSGPGANNYMIASLLHDKF